MRRLLLSKALAVALSRSKPCMSCGCSSVAFSMSVRRVCNTNSTQLRSSSLRQHPCTEQLLVNHVQRSLVQLHLDTNLLQASHTSSKAQLEAH